MSAAPLTNLTRETADDPDVSLTVPEVARRLGVAGKSVRRWIRRGLLRAYRVGPHGQWRIPLGELARLTRREPAASGT